MKKAIILLLFFITSYSLFSQRQATLGGNQPFNNSTTFNVRIDRIDDTHVLVVYKDGNNDTSSDLKAVIGEVDPATKTITYGNPATIEVQNNRFSSVTVMSATKAIVSYENDHSSGNAQSDSGYTRVLTLNTNTDTILVHTVTDFLDNVDGAGAHNNISMIKLTETTFALLYSSDGVAGSVADNGTVKIGTADFTTNSVTYGPAQEFEAIDASNLWGAALSATKIVITYGRVGGNGKSGTAVVGTISGNSVTFGNKVEFHDDSQVNTFIVSPAVVAISESKFVVIYNDKDTKYAYAKPASVSGTAITFGSRVIVEDVQETFDLTVDLIGTNNEFIVAYNGGAGADSKVRVGQLNSDNTIDFNSKDKFLTAKLGDDSYVTALDANTFVVGYVDDEETDPSIDLGECVVGELITNTWQGDDATSPTDWFTGENWSLGRAPNSSDYVVIPAIVNSPVISSGVTAKTKDLVLEGNLTVNSNAAFTIFDDAIINGNFQLESSSSLKVSGQFTGIVTYRRKLPTTNWYLLSSPVKNVGVKTFYTVNTSSTVFDSGSGTTPNKKVGIGNYNNNASAGNRWEYYVDGDFDGNNGDDTTDSFDKGKGYSIKTRLSNINLKFQGTGLFTAIDAVTRAVTLGTNNNFNLIGNPYTSYFNSKDFLTSNSDKIESSIWVWNQSANGANQGDYEVKASIDEYIVSPAQGFFVEAKSNSNVNFHVITLSHQSTDTFLKSDSEKYEVKLFLNDENSRKYTKIYYVNGATTGFDNGYEGKLFGGVSQSFSIFSELIEENEGVKYQLQSLPKSNFQDMIIPIGVKASKGKEIFFSIETLNLPSELNVYLEDRLNNTVTNLKEEGSNYKVTLSDDLNGVGRFYLYTSAKSLSLDSSKKLSSISLYKTSNNQLKLSGLLSGNYNLTMYDIVGKKIFENKFNASNTYLFSLPKFKKGVYLVKLNAEFGNFNKKIIIE